MFLTSLCRAYGALGILIRLPTALPWANLRARLAALWSIKLFAFSRWHGWHGFTNWKWSYELFDPCKSVLSVV